MLGLQRGGLVFSPQGRDSQTSHLTEIHPRGLNSVEWRGFQHETQRLYRFRSTNPTPPTRGCGRARGPTAAWQLTADGEERVGLLALHRGHTFQGIEASPADVDPTLHLRLAKPGAEQGDGDDVELLPGGIHLLGTPGGRRLTLLTKG